MDVFGNALLDFYHQRSPAVLWLNNSYDEPEEMPVAVFFRDEDEMPELEMMALNQCRGSILDVGAGVGSHALLLQKAGHDVTAIDISKDAVDIMKLRGVQKAVVQDVHTVKDQYDTLLLLMNGIGLTGTLAGLTEFLELAKSLVKPGGQLLFDSSDISYLYEDLPRPTAHYYGEISYCYTYKAISGNWFNWLYVDPDTLKRLAAQTGWATSILYHDEDDHYLARLTLTAKTD